MDLLQSLLPSSVKLNVNDVIYEWSLNHSMHLAIASALHPVPSNSVVAPETAPDARTRARTLKWKNLKSLSFEFYLFMQRSHYRP